MNGGVNENTRLSTNPWMTDLLRSVEFARSLARLMDHYALQCVDVALPWFFGKDVLGMGVTGTPTVTRSEERRVGKECRL